MIKDTDMMTPKVALQLITNISRMTAYRYIKQVRVHLGKSSEQIVTVKEFRTYYGI